LWSVFEKLVEGFAEATPCAEGADFDDRRVPSGEGCNLWDGAFLEVKEGDDDTVFGFE
jgi:hypothetical protein